MNIYEGAIWNRSIAQWPHYVVVSPERHTKHSLDVTVLSALLGNDWTSILDVRN
jgi:hypothetical protein